MPKVYVACKFRPEDRRTYTYEWDGEPLNKGDIVKVPDKSGDGWQRVTIDAVSDQAPPFPCKPILGLYNPDVEPEEEPNNDAAALARKSTYEPPADAAADPLDADLSF